MRSALRTVAMAGVLIGGCTSDYTFTDSVNSRGLMFMERSEFGDELSTPYVLGARFTIFILDTQRNTDMKGWTVSATNPDVLQILNVEPRRVDAFTLELDAVAANIGTTELLLMDPGGELQGSASVEVRMPTRVKLFAAAIAALENKDFIGETPRPVLMAGGVASFGVQYFDDDLRLQGSTDLKVESSRALAAEVEQSEVVNNRDVLQLAASDQTGPHAVDLLLGKLRLQTITVEVVPPSAISGVELIHKKGSSPDEAAGEWLVVAQAHDAMRRPVYGVDFDWTFPGRSFITSGDVLVYEYDPDPDKMKRVSARAGAYDSSISLQAADGEVFTSNDEAFNCNVTGDAPAPWWAAICIALPWLRRRRR
jgi:MYXO-CTERM domain-containing protein